MDHFHFTKQGFQKIRDRGKLCDGKETAIAAFLQAEGNMDVKTRHLYQVRNHILRTSTGIAHTAKSIGNKKVTPPFNGCKHGHG